MGVSPSAHFWHLGWKINQTVTRSHVIKTTSSKYFADGESTWEHTSSRISNIRKFSLPPIPAPDHKIVLLHQAVATFLDIFAHIINTAFFRHFEKKPQGPKNS